jgi:hypothetical protein
MVTAGVKDLSETVVYKFLVKGNDVKFLSYRMFKSFYQFLSVDLHITCRTLTKDVKIPGENTTVPDNSQACLMSDNQC